MMMDRERRFQAYPIAVLIASLLLSACGSSKEMRETATSSSYHYAPVAEMSDAVVTAADGGFSVRCPKGWQETVDQKNAPGIVAWLVREDYAASISFSPIIMNPALFRTLQKDGLLAVAKVGLSLKKESARDSLVVVRPPERFAMNGREYAAYEYSADGHRTTIRVVVFDTGKQFMECVLMPAVPDITPAENRRLFEIQQAVLASMIVR